jgi:hypothetical protein
MVLKKVKFQVKSDQSMQRLALLLLLAITASMIFAFEMPILAQEAPEEPTGEEAMEEEMTDEELADDTMMEEEAMEEEMTDEELADDTMMEEEAMEEEMTDEELADDTMMEEIEDVDSPLEQMVAGTDPHEIQCKAGQKLVFKASNWRPSCINESSYDILAARGWVSSHDPTHDDLAMMVDEYMTAHPQETEEPEATEEEIEIEEDVMVEEEAIPGNGTESEVEGETEPQSYSVELSESMDMGAQ